MFLLQRWSCYFKSCSQTGLIRVWNSFTVNASQPHPHPHPHPKHAAGTPFIFYVSLHLRQSETPVAFGPSGRERWIYSKSHKIYSIADKGSFAIANLLEDKQEPSCAGGQTDTVVKRVGLELTREGRGDHLWMCLSLTVACCDAQKSRIYINIQDTDADVHLAE